LSELVVLATDLLAVVLVVVRDWVLEVVAVEEPAPVLPPLG
jgi:hypothetical protein